MRHSYLNLVLLKSQIKIVTLYLIILFSRPPLKRAQQSRRVVRFHCEGSSLPCLHRSEKSEPSGASFNLKTANMDRVPYLDLQAQYHRVRTEVLAALREICESGRFA